MREASTGAAESKQKASETKEPEPPPGFEPRLVLDAVRGEFTDHKSHAKITLLLVDGTEFVCFADGVTLKGWSDRFLQLAGHMILQSRGEAPDLRPLHELDESDADDVPPIPTVPPQAPGDPYDAQRDALLHAKATPVPETQPAPAAPSLPALPQAPEPTEATGWEQGVPFVGVSVNATRRAEKTRDFVEAFKDKPDEWFQGTFARELVRTQLALVDQTDPAVREIAARADLPVET